MGGVGFVESLVEQSRGIYRYPTEQRSRHKPGIQSFVSVLGSGLKDVIYDLSVPTIVPQNVHFEYPWELQKKT